MNELNEQCARLDGACVHDWERIYFSTQPEDGERWRCLKCPKETKVFSGSAPSPKPPTTLPYDTDIKTAVEFARRMKVYLIIHRCHDAVYILIGANTVRGCRDLEVGIYSQHNNDECVAEAAATCRAVVVVKGG